MFQHSAVNTGIMNNTFETFNPKHSIIAKYVDYYYLDIKPDNELTEFDCFPHYNTSISIYKSHRRLQDGTMIFDNKAKPFQIFTPIRESKLTVRQTGVVHRIVIVFNPLGIQQFYNEFDFAKGTINTDFFSPQELDDIFATKDPGYLTSLLDTFLLDKYSEFSNEILEKSVNYIFKHFECFSVEKLSDEIQISRRHINRLFRIHLGISVKRFHEIVLFRKTLQHKLLVNPADNFTQLAYEFNFCDQSHLNKIFKKLTSDTPIQFFKKGTILGKGDTFWHISK